MENTMSQYGTIGMPIREALADKIRQLPIKDFYAIAGIISFTLIAVQVVVCATKSDISIGNGLLEIKHSDIVNRIT